MASTSSTSSAFLLFSIIILFTASVPNSVSSFRFEVGEEVGWKMPNGEEPETYNEWAAQNRFQIGDTLHFKYQNDSVLVVSFADYSNCNTANPVSKFEDGSSVFRFDRSGFFYFISGQPGHCKSGQRLIVRVMHPSEIGVSSPAPAPADGADRSDYADWGPHAGVNSGIKLGVVSFYASTGILFGLIYLFI
ncbi:early nodulin-like protein 21 [Henckelia pumila]|uniref:early nodulin-like protein 21 n=1 Tax=Henckelia pumila TaxID=405737 RepID=UPI003C6DCDB8